MPFKRNTKKKTSSSSTAAKALSIALKNKKLLNQREIKTLITAAVSTPSNIGLVETLCEIAQGADYNDRDGNIINLKSNHLKGWVTINAASTFTDVRIMIFIDTDQESDTPPVPADLLQSLSTISSLNVTSYGRYKILHSKNYLLSAERPAAEFNFYKKLNMPMKFNGITDDDIQKNGLYLLMISSEAVNEPTINWNNRLSFTDS